MAATQKNRPIQIATPLGEDVLLFYRMSGKERISELYEYEVDVLSEKHSIKAEDLLGKNVTIGLFLPDDKVRYFNGYVTRFGHHGSVEDYALYRITVHPWLWFLTRTVNCRIFQKQTVKEIIQKICEELKFTEFKFQLSGQQTKREYCVQYRETDFNFVSRLLEEEGYYYYFTHEESGKHCWEITDSPGGHKPYPGYAKIPYNQERGSSDRARVDHIYDWEFTKQIQSGAYALTDFSVDNPRTDLNVKLASPKSHPHSAYEYFDYPGRYTDTGQGNNLVRVRLEELESRYAQHFGTGNARGLATGYHFNFQNAPRKDQEGDYLILSTYYRLALDAYTSKGSSGGNDETFVCSFTAIPKTQHYRAPRITPKPLIHGAQTALVVGPKGEEIHTDKLGRVMVQFHWDRYGKMQGNNQEGSSCWVRVSQGWAGKGWGMMVIPRIGQEVIVDFLEGDPDQPIITGRVYNGVNTPHYDLPQYATYMSIKSNTTKGGGGFNELRFDDKKGNEQIFVHAERDHHLRIKKDSFEWIGEKRHLIVNKDQLEEVKGDKHLTVTGNRNEQVKGTLSVEAKQDYQEKAGSKYALDAGQEIHLKGGTNVVIEAGTNLTLKVGGNFVVIDSTGVSIKGTMVNINSGGAAGSGAGSTPDAPKPPEEAVDDTPGKVDEPKPAPKPPKPITYGPSATVLKMAAKQGTPFCQKCAEAAAANAAAANAGNSAAPPSH